MARPGGRAATTVTAWLASLAWLASPVPADAQEAGPQGRGCTLVLEPATDSTRSVRVQVQPNRYVTHVGNGLFGRCGDARMNADSAVSYGAEQRVRMIGSVDYRDSVRTLTADTLTYFQAEDRVVAVGDVVVVRPASGSRLSGPRVEFDRVRSPQDRRTVATGRSRLLVFPDSASRDPAARDTASPVQVDADRIVMLGEREVRTWGDVQIRRAEIDARADSAFFHLEAGSGRLMGAPRVDGETFTLTGDTIFTGFDQGALREVESVSEARASGEDFELYARRIRARMTGEELDRLWAYGEGRSVAVSPPYRLAADSLDTAFAAGEMDTLYAVGTARALEIGDAADVDPREPITLTAGERSWITGDSLVFSFARRLAVATGDSAGALPDAVEKPPDTAAVPDSLTPVAPSEADGEEGAGGPAASGDTRLEKVRAAGDARAYHVLEPAQRGDPPSRDYQLARVIEIYLEEGEVARVEGQEAVGVHLDPVEGGATRRAPPAPTDTVRGDRPPVAAPADTAPEAESDTTDRGGQAAEERGRP